MIRILFLPSLLFATFGYSQTNCDLLKKENEALQSTNKVLTSENEYLKKVFDINKPILEAEKDNSSFKITKILGNKAGKIIEIAFLIEAKDISKKFSIENVSIVDAEGNEYKIDLYKSSKPFPQLQIGIPVKLTFSFKDIQGEPLFIKLFRFKTNSNSEKSPLGGINSYLEFKDLKVVWN